MLTSPRHTDPSTGGAGAVRVYGQSLPDGLHLVDVFLRDGLGDRAHGNWDSLSSAMSPGSERQALPRLTTSMQIFRCFGVRRYYFGTCCMWWHATQAMLARRCEESPENGGRPAHPSVAVT